jgi:hypothetical protein
MRLPAFMIATIVAPSWDRSKLRTRSCLVVRLREPEARAAFCPNLKLRRFETLERERDFAFDRAIGTSEMGDTIVAPPRPRPGQQTTGSALRRSPAASVTNSNAPIPREVQQNMSNLVAQLPLSWAVAKSALLELSPTSRTKRQGIASRWAMQPTRNYGCSLHHLGHLTLWGVRVAFTMVR